jgi:hypothetical protein
MKKYTALIERARHFPEITVVNSVELGDLILDLAKALEETEQELHNTESTINHLRHRRNHFRQRFYMSIKMLNELVKVDDFVRRYRDEAAAELAVAELEASTQTVTLMDVNNVTDAPEFGSRPSWL